MALGRARPDYTIHASHVGPGYRVDLVDYDHRYRRPPHAHDESGITLVVDGQMWERVRRSEQHATSLSVVVKPAGTVHENLVGPRGARTVAVTILDEEELVGEAGRLGTWRWFHACPVVEPLLGLGRALLYPDVDLDPGEIVLELLGVVAELPAPCEGDAPAWILRAREALDDLAVEGIEVRELADRLRVHPVSLTRAFRRAYGVPITTYRRRVRLQRAAQRVTGTADSLCSIAHESGFSDHAHMCREVRGLTGVTPSDLRAVARVEGVDPRDPVALPEEGASGGGGLLH